MDATQIFFKRNPDAEKDFARWGYSTQDIRSFGPIRDDVPRFPPNFRLKLNRDFIRYCRRNAFRLRALPPVAQVHRAVTEFEKDHQDCLKTVEKTASETDKITEYYKSEYAKRVDILRDVNVHRFFDLINTNFKVSKKDNAIHVSCFIRLRGKSQYSPEELKDDVAVIQGIASDDISVSLVQGDILVGFTTVIQTSAKVTPFFLEDVSRIVRKTHKTARLQ